MKIKAYHKNFEYTYTLGVFETIELLKNKPELVLRVYIKSNSYKNKGIEIIENLCKRNKIDLIEVIILLISYLEKIIVLQLLL